MINSIIVDDEPHCIERLSKLIHTNFGSSVKILDSFSTVDEALAGSKRLRPDLVFLDMQIHDKTGFDLLTQLNPVDFDVIFTTAYEQYAVQAFRFSAVDYLLKPVDVDDLSQALHKVEAHLHLAQHSKKIDMLLDNLRNTSIMQKKIGIPTITGITYITVGDIIRCESEINYTTLHFTDRKKITVAKTLKEFEETLEPYNFFRVHNSHLVNLLLVKSYHKGKGGYLCMKDDSEIEVSTRRKDELLKRLSTL